MAIDFFNLEQQKARNSKKLTTEDTEITEENHRGKS